MACGSSCVGTIESGGNYYLLDLKDVLPENGGKSELGPLAVLAAVEYSERYAAARALALTADDPERDAALTMLSSLEQTDTLTEGELRAYGARILGTDLLDPNVMGEHQLVIAYEDRRGLPSPNNSLSNIS